MVKVINGVKNWASILDDNTRLQAEMLSRSEVICGHVALMPDAHVGMGATVGSVIPTKNAVIPAAIGVDIGCGMIAVNTGQSRDDLPEDMNGLHADVARSVPAGVGRGGAWSPNNRAYGQIGTRYAAWLRENPSSIRSEEIQDRNGSLTARASLQIGTLGSGNHFVEMGLDGDGVLWVVIHSGSRDVGNKLAMHHIEIAQNLCKTAGTKLEDRDLAYLVEGTPEFDNYIYDMEWAQRYALLNRKVMMDQVLGQLYRSTREVPEVTRINCHHNFTQRETHFGQDVWLTRKGAIYAGEDAPGVVPGSMATGIFITKGKGKGNLDSYQSSAHGAGRVRSRGAAKRELNLDGEDGLYNMMEGIAWNVEHAKGLMDEHPLAYKDIQQVMQDQADLCDSVGFIRPILNYKGA